MSKLEPKSGLDDKTKWAVYSLYLAEHGQRDDGKIDPGWIESMLKGLGVTLEEVESRIMELYGY